MLRDNYETLAYTREMSLALHDVTTVFSIKDAAKSYRRIKLRQAFEKFELYLELQTNNITELGEEDLTEALRADFNYFRETIWALRYEREVPVQVIMQSLNMQGLLEQVYKLNEDRIKQKTDEAINIANRVTLFMIILGFLFFVFVVISMFYFPDYIADPINELADSIKEVARKNYSLRLDTSSKDEFGEVARSFNEMAEKLDEYESMNVLFLLSEKKRIETIINEMNDAIIGVDQNKQIIFVNLTMLQLSNLEEADLVGKQVEEVLNINPIMGQVFKEVMSGIGGLNGARNYPGVSLNQNGKTYYYERDVFQIGDGQLPAGEAGGFVIILKNITEFKEKDLAKTNFMATLSHELKTPLSAIDMSLGLLRDKRIGALNEEQEDLARTIQHNSARILNMVNEILDISKIETGNISINEADVHPKEIVDKAVEGTKTFLEQKKIRLEYSIQPKLPNLKIDVEKTMGVLVNFLTNAIRYSEKGEMIKVVIRKKQQAVEFSVWDNGPGISKDDQEKIFTRYTRAKNDKTKGTGLGLAISKEFIEKQGGKIWVKSELNKGSVFGFELPISQN